MMFAEICLMVFYGLFVENEVVPKPVFPDPGPEDIPGILDLVQPFKRYPPGFDNFVGSARSIPITAFPLWNVVDAPWKSSVPLYIHQLMPLSEIDPVRHCDGFFRART